MKRQVKFFDAARQDHFISDKINFAIQKVVDSGVFSDGENTHILEESLAFQNKVKYCALVGSGTIAIEIILRALGFTNQSDLILTTDNSFFATASAVVNAGATPIFVDTDDSCLMDLNQVESKLKSFSIKAVLAVNLYGNLIDLDALQKICEKYNVILLIDGAQNFWCQSHGRSTTNFARAEAMSFYTTKSLGCYGESGAVFTDDIGIYKFAKSYRNHGRSTTGYCHELMGVNGRSTEIQAAILYQKLLKSENYWISRVNSKDKYIELLSPNKDILLNWNETYNLIVPYVFPVFCSCRDELKKFLAENGIQTVIHYPTPLHNQPALYNYSNGNFPNTEKQCSQTLSLPFYANMPEEDIEYVCEKVNEFFNK